VSLNLQVHCSVFVYDLFPTDSFLQTNIMLCDPVNSKAILYFTSTDHQFQILALNRLDGVDIMDILGFDVTFADSPTLFIFVLVLSLQVSGLISELCQIYHSFLLNVLHCQRNSNLSILAIKHTILIIR